MPAASSICSVADPSQVSNVGPHRCHASAASSHCCLVVRLYCWGSKVALIAAPRLAVSSQSRQIRDRARQLPCGSCDRSDLLLYEDRMEGDAVSLTDLTDLTNVFVDPTAYADEERFHDACRVLRREHPVVRVESERYRPFWAITRHAD